jgi:S-adenosylhomocysteine hydrolase
MINDYDYPLLQRITDFFQHNSKESIKNVHIWACQHILEPQEKMFVLISEFGIPVKNIHILGKIYSTNFEVLDDLQKLGFQVTQPEFDFTCTFDEQHKESCQKLFESFMQTNKTGDRAIILDDGAELLNIFNTYREKINPRIDIIGIEQTSSGFRKLEKENIKFPVINVARSAIKLNKESPLIAQLGCDRINDVIKKYNISEPRILVVGLGPMGNNVLLILKEEGYFVMGHDTIFDSKAEIVGLIVKNKINVLIGVTGSNILSEQQIQELESKITDGLYLISMSSSDREFSASFLRKNGKFDKNIHGDSVWRKVVLINNGFPITFKGKHYESTPLEIEKTIALLYGSVLYATTGDLDEQGFIDVPKQIDDIIQNNE